MPTSDHLHIAVIQPDLHWENRDANLQHLEVRMSKLVREPVDLIVLPEMFTTGFSMNASELSEPEEGKTLAWMRQNTARWNTAVTGSFMVKENNAYFNRLFFVKPDGNYETYDKRHMFSYAGEDKVFSRGKERLVVEYMGWKICPLICYDLRFPVWSRNTHSFDVLIYVANWPESRIRAWDTLLPARAVENICFTIGANRVGKDGNGINYCGHSAVNDPLGRVLVKSEKDKEDILRTTLEKEVVEKIRRKYPFLNDRDAFTV